MQIYADCSNKLNSKCYTSDRGGHPILLLVCHNTEGKNESNTGQSRAEAQQHSDFEAQYLTSNQEEVSIHWVVGEEECDAPIYKIVPEQHTAYHCGGTPPKFVSKWVNPEDGKSYGGFNLNQVAIGIELVGQHDETVGSKQLAALQALVLDIFSRYPILKRKGHIVAHKELEGDRQDGANWIKQAIEWVSGVDTDVPTPVIELLSYKVTIPQVATVRKGPGRDYDVITTLKADSTKQYQVDGEAHGDNINGDDVWSHLNDGSTKGFVSRSALTILH